MEKETDLRWVDFIRVVATFLVVWLHSAAPLLSKYNELPISYWWIGNIYDSLVRMSVPLFFMVSGFLLIEKTEPLNVFFQKRIRKVIVPMLAWSIIYIFWKAYYEQSSSISFYSFYSILLTPSYYHLWFLYAIVGVYLYVPILRIFVQNSDKIHLYYFVALWIIAVSLIPFAEKATGVTSKIDLKMISGFVGYLIIGHLAGKIIIHKKIIGYSIGCFVACAGITAFGTYYLTQKNGAFVGILYSYLSPNVIFLSISSFILLRTISENTAFLNNEKIISMLKVLSSTSLGIYLIHTMFLYVFENGFLGYQLNVLHSNPLYSVPLTAFLSFSFSFVAIFFLKKFPYISKIVP